MKELRSPKGAKEVHSSGSAMEAERKGTSVPFWATWVTSLSFFWPVERVLWHIT